MEVRSLIPGVFGVPKDAGVETEGTSDGPVDGVAVPGKPEVVGSVFRIEFLISKFKSLTKVSLNLNYVIHHILPGGLEVRSLIPGVFGVSEDVGVETEGTLDELIDGVEIPGIPGIVGSVFGIDPEAIEFGC